MRIGHNIDFATETVTSLGMEEVERRRGRKSEDPNFKEQEPTLPSLVAEFIWTEWKNSKKSQKEFAELYGLGGQPVVSRSARGETTIELKTLDAFLVRLGIQTIKFLSTLAIMAADRRPAITAAGPTDPRPTTQVLPPSGAAAPGLRASKERSPRRQTKDRRGVRGAKDR